MCHTADGSCRGGDLFSAFANRINNAYSFFDPVIINAKGETVSGEVGTVHVTLDGTSAWTLTADTYITSFSGDLSSIAANGHALYVNGEKVL